MPLFRRLTSTLLASLVAFQPVLAHADGFYFRLNGSGAHKVEAFAVTGPNPLPGHVGSRVTGPYYVTGGTGPFAWSSKGFPDGFEIRDGLLVGTPTETGTYAGTVSVVDATGAVASLPVELQVRGTLKLVGVGDTQGNVGTPIRTRAPVIQGDPVTPVTFTVVTGQLPPGLTLDPATGVVSGTPTVDASSTLTLKVEDATGADAVSASFSVTISPFLALTTAAVAPARVGRPWSLQAPAIGGVYKNPVRWALAHGPLPAGVAMSPYGALSGTPTAAGSFPGVAIAATDASGRYGTTSGFEVDVLPPLAFASASDQTYRVGSPTPSTAYGSTIANPQPPQPTGSPVAPVRWTSGSTTAPAGLAVDPASGTLKGTPGVPGDVAMALTVTDATGGSATTPTFTAHVLPALVMSSVADVAVATNVDLASPAPTVTGGPVGSLVWSVAPGLPDGLALDAATGAISGRTAAGYHAATTLTATDAAGYSVSSNPFALDVRGPFSLSAYPSAAGIQGIAATYPAPIVTGKPVGALTWTVGSPATVNGAGAATFAPANSGYQSVTVTATDQAGNAAQAVLTVWVAPVPSATYDLYHMTGSVLASGVATGHVGTPLLVPMVTGGGVTAPPSFKRTGGTPPVGVDVVTATGALTGTPTAVGATTVVTTMTDAAKATAVASLPLAVVPAMTVTAGRDVDGRVGLALAGPAPKVANVLGRAHWDVAAGSEFPPPGVYLGDDGSFSGTPQAPGTAAVRVTVTDDTGAAATTRDAAVVTVLPALSFEAVRPVAGLTGVPLRERAPTIDNLPALPVAYSPFGDLPPGLSIDPKTGDLAGTPTQTGTWTVAFSATDAQGATATSPAFAVTVTPGVPLAAAPDRTLRVGVAASIPAPAPTGTPAVPLAWSFPTSVPGLSVDRATGLLSGSPTQAGEWPTATLAVTDAEGATGTATFRVLVRPPLGLGPEDALLARVGAAFDLVRPPIANDPTVPLSWTVTGLPQGLGYDAASGEITGTPTIATTAGTPAAAAPVTVTTTVVDAGGATASDAFGLTVLGPLSFGPAPDVAATAGTQADLDPPPLLGGPVQPTAWSLAAGTLPTGVTVDPSTGHIVGTMPEAGIWTVSLQVSDATGGSATSVAFKVIGRAAFTVADASNPVMAGHVGSALTRAAPTVTGTPRTPTTWSLASGALPPGVAVDPATGAISGVATAPSDSDAVSVGLLDSYGGSAATTPYPVVVTPPLSFDPTVAMDGRVGSMLRVGSSYGTVTVAARGSNRLAPPVYAVAGANPPPGVVVDPATGAIGGIPTASGIFSMAVAATDAAGGAATSPAFAVTIAPALVVNVAAAPVGRVGDAYATAAPTVANGPVAPIKWARTGQRLAKGLTFDPNTGVVSGTPQEAIDSNIEVNVTDALTDSAFAPLEVKILPPLSLAGPSAPVPAHVGVPFSLAAPTVTNQPQAPLAFAVASGTLPAGLALSRADGSVSGTPTTPGDATVALSVTDAAGDAATSPAFVIHVTPPLAASTPGGYGRVGQAHTQAAAPTVPDGVAPLTFALASGALPAGLALNPDGTVSGTPTALGTSTYALAVTDAIGGRATTPSTTMRVLSPLTASFPANLYVRVGAPYLSVAPTIAGNPVGTPTFGHLQGAFVDGMAVDPATGRVTGTPTASSSNWTDTIVGTDGDGYPFQSNAFSVTVLQNGPIVANAVKSPALVHQGSPGLVPAPTFGNTAGALSYALATGTLPLGMAVDPAAGTVTGTATAQGDFRVSVGVVDQTQAHATSPAFTISVLPPLVVGSVAAGYGRVGLAQRQIQAPDVSGNPVTPFKWTFGQGTAPGGLALDPAAGFISGTPSTAGSYSMALTVTDAAGGVATTAPFALPVYAPLVAGSGGTWALRESVPVTIPAPAVANSPVAPVYWTTPSAVPTGFAFDPQTGALSGTPGTGLSGTTASFVARVTDNDGAAADDAGSPASISFYPPLAFATVPSATMHQGSPASIAKPTVLNHPVAPLVVALAQGSAPLPDGLTLATDGSATGAPTTPGASSLSYLATDATGGTATSNAFAVTVLPPLTLQVADGAGVVTLAGTQVPAPILGGSPVAPVRWSLGAGETAPGGLSLDTGTGALRGIPGLAGTTTLHLVATDAAQGVVTSNVFKVVVSPAPTIGPATLEVTAGVPVSKSLATLMNAANYTSNPAAWVATGLPAGLSVSSDGMLSGTATATVETSATVAVTATDGDGLSSRANLALTVGLQPTIASASKAIAVGRVASLSLAQLLSATNLAAPRWTATGLPSTLSLSITGLLSGTPTATGSYAVVVTVANDTGETATATLTLAVDVTPSASPATLTVATGRPASANLPTAMAATNAASAAYSVVGLPAGLAVDATGALSGTPTSAGTTQVAVTLTNPDGVTGTATLTVVVSDPPSLSDGSLTAYVGAALLGSAPGTLRASGVTGGATWSAPGAPSWLTMDAGGNLSASPVPTTATTATFPVTVTNPNGIATTATLTVATATAAPAASTYPTSVASDAGGGNVLAAAYDASGATQFGIAYTYAYQVKGNCIRYQGGPLTPCVQYAYTDDYSEYPVYVAFPQATLVDAIDLSGTEWGTPSVAWCSAGCSANGATFTSVPVSWNGTSWSLQVPVATTALRVYGSAYAHANGAGRTASGIRFGSSGAFPAYLPSTSAATLTPTVGQPFTASLDARMATANASGTETWSYTGTLPAGLALSPSGTLSGTATAAGSSALQVTVTDARGVPSVPTTLTVATSLAPTLSAGSLTISSAGPMASTALATTMGATNLSSPTWTQTGLPAGLSLSTSGALTGTPAATGTTTATVTVTNANGGVASAQLTVTVDVPPSIAAASGTFGTGSAASVDLTVAMAAANAASATWSATGLPATLSVSAAGRLAGTPTTAASYAVAVTARNPDGLSATANYAVTVAAPPALRAGTDVAYVGGTYQGNLATALSATGLATPTWSQTGLPAGLTLDPATGLVTGTSPPTGSYTVAVTATNANGLSGGATLTLTAQVPTLNSALVAYWAYGEGTGTTAGDSVGAYPLTLPRATLWAPGVVGGGLAPGLFNAGSNAAFSGRLTGNAARTESAWFNGTSTGGTLVDWGSHSAGMASQLGVDATGHPYMSDWNVALVGSQGGANDGRWHLATATYDGSRRTVYLDGVAVGSDVATENTSASAVVVGAGVGGASNTIFQGTVDEVGVWGRALSAAEVASLYNSGSGSTAPFTVATPSLTAAAAVLPTGRAATMTLATSMSLGSGYEPTWNVSGAPNGVTVDPRTGVLSVAANAAAGTSAIAVTATNFGGAAASATLTLTLDVPPNLAATSLSLPVNRASSTALASAMGATGLASPAWSYAGSLPAGMALSTDGTLSGTPTANGQTTATVTVANADGLSASATLTVGVVTPAASTLGSGLVAFWTLDEGTGTTAADTTGSYPLAVTGNPWTAAGEVGAGFLPSTSAYGTGATFSGQLTGSAARTMSAWFKTTGTAGAALVSWGSYNNSQLSELVVLGTGAIRFGGYYNDLDTPKSGFNDGRWHLATATYDASGRKVYVDGALQASDANGLSTSASAVYVGRSAGGGQNLGGTLDEVGVWNRALTAAEVANLYNSGASNSPLLATATGYAGHVAPVSTPATRVTGRSVAPLSFALASGALPAGLSLDPGTGAVTGTPTATGTSTVTIGVTDAVGSKATTANVTFTVAAPLTATAAPGATLALGRAGSVPGPTVANAAGATTFAVASGAIPAGMTLSTTTGALSGTPTAAGPATYALSVSDGTPGGTATAGSTTVAVDVPPAVSAATVALTVSSSGTTDLSAAMSATGLATPAWAATGLPSWATLSGAGILSGTPTQAGTSTAQVTVTNADGLSATAALTLVAKAPTTSALSGGLLAYWRLDEGSGATAADTAGNFPLTIVGNPWTASGEVGAGFAPSSSPAAYGTSAAFSGQLTGSAARTMSGWFRTTGSNYATIVSWGGYNNNQLSSLSVGSTGGVRFGGYYNDLDSSKAGFNDGAWHLATGTYDGTTRKVYVDGVLLGTDVPGLSTTASAVKVGVDTSGANTTTGTGVDEVGLWNRALSATEVANLYGNGVANSPVAVKVTNVSNGAAHVGDAVATAAPVVSGRTTGAIAFSSTGTVAPGTSINPTTGSLVGTPTTQGAYAYAVVATDAAGNQGSSPTVTLTVVPTMTATTPPSTTLALGSAGAVAGPVVTNAYGTASFSLASGAVPTGMTLSAATGGLSGTPTATGAFAYAVKVTDNAGSVTTGTATVTVDAPPALTVASLPSATTGSAVSANLATAMAATGLSGATWTASGLPSWATLSPAGVLSGTAGSAGSTTASITVTNGDGLSATATLSVTVTGALSLSPGTASAKVGTAFTGSLPTLMSAMGLSSPTWSASGLPAGVTLTDAANGVLSGTPTAAGTSTVAVTATNAGGATASANLTLTVAANVATGSLSNGMVAYWRFDEGAGTVATDSVGGHNLTIPSPTWATGVSGGALSFANANVATGPWNLLSGGSARTMSTWFKTTDGGRFQIPMMLGTGGGNVGQDALCLTGGSLGFCPGGPYAGTTFAASYADGNWHLLTATYDSGTVVVYFDGALLGRGVVSLATSSVATAYLGGSNSAGYGLSGSMDEAQVWNRALSASEVSALFSTKSLPATQTATSGQLALFHMDEGSGSTITDAVSGRVASVTNAPWSPNGASGSALTFTGSSNSLATAPWGQLTGAAPRTMNVWFNTTSATAADWMSFGTNASKSLSQLGLYNGAIGFLGFGADVTVPATTSNYLNGAWHMLTAAYDGATMRVYVDGALANSGALALTTGAGNLVLGNAVQGGNAYAGALDEAGLWGRALSASEVATLYNAGTPAKTANAVNLANGLVASWHLDETSGTTAADSASGLYPLTVNGTLGAAGRIGAAATFTGAANQYAYNSSAWASATPITGAAGRTQSAWFKTTTANQALISWGQGGGAVSELQIDASGRIALYNGTSSVTGGQTGLNDGTWHLGTVTYDGTTATVYVDGSRQASGALAMATAGSNLGVGTRTGSSLYFNGAIDEPVVWSRALNASEVAALYGAGAGQSTDAGSVMAGQMAYWKFDEGAGSVARDSVGSADGTFSASPAWTTGVLGTAATLSGSNVITLNASPALQQQQFPLTVAGWVYATSTSGAHHVYGAYSAANNQSLSSILRVQDGALMFIGSTASGQYYQQTSNGPAVSANAWHFVAATIGGSPSAPTVTLKVDGAQSTSTFAQLGTVASSVPLTLGGNPNTAAYFAGSIDELGVWNRVLSAAELQTLYLSKSPSAGPSLSAGTMAAVVGQTFSGSAATAMGAGAGSVSNWAVTGGALPSGLAIDPASGIVSGIAAAAGSTTATVTATGRNGATSSAALTVAVTQPTTSTGLLDLWHFDEGAGTVASDAVGGRNAVVSGATWTAGASGGALALTVSTTSGAKVAFSGLTGAAPRTMATWFKTTATGTAGLMGYGSSSSGQQAALQFISGLLMFTGYNADVSTSQTPYVDGNWHQVVYTYDGAKGTLYVDGVAKASAAQALNTVGSGTMYLGGGANGDAALAGSIDEPAVWNRALSASEVAQVFGQGAPQAPQTVSNGLVAMFHMDEGTGTTTTDAVSGRVATTAGSPTWGAGASGSSLTFSGANNATAPWAQMTGNVPRSMSAWIKTTTGGNALGIVGWGGTAAQYQQSELCLSTSTAVGFCGSGNDLYFAANYTDGNWHMVTDTWDGSTMTVYFDGAKIGSGSVAALQTTSSTLTIGSSTANGFYYKGAVDEAGVWSRSLSASEVAALYNAGAPAKVSNAVNLTQGQVAYWRFEEQTGTTASDAAGSYPLTLASSGMWTTAGRIGGGIAATGVAATTGANSSFSSSGLGGNAARTESSWFKTTTQVASGTVATLLGYGSGGTGNNNASDLCIFGAQIGYCGNNNDLFANATYADGAWHMFTVTHDGATMVMYLDGRVIGSGAKTLSTTAGGVGSGYSPANGGRYFTGSLDEQGIWNRALNGSEVAALYNQGLGASPNAPVSLSTGLIDQWRFDDATGVTVTDATGSLPGTWSGSVSAQWGAGVLNGAGAFTTSDYVAMPSTTLLPSGAAPRSMSAWFKTTNGSSATMPIMGYGSGSTGALFELDSFQGGVRFTAYGNDLSETAVPTADGGWHLATVTYDGSRLILYVDGVVTLASASGQTLQTPTNGALYFGARSGTPGYPGSVDEAQLWGRALSPSEVAALYASKSPTNAPTLAAGAVTLTHGAAASAAVAPALAATASQVASWALVGGSLPVGVYLDPATGRLTGTAPATMGSYAAQVQATGQNGATATAVLTVTVN